MKINLIKNRPLGSSRLKKLRLISQLMMMVVIGGFLLEVFYVAGRIVYLKAKINSTTKNINSLNASLNSTKGLVENYVWSQSVLDKMLSERKNEYKYKDYLLEIYSWLTPGTSLIGVNFVEKSYISIMISAADVDRYRDFEKKLAEIVKREDFIYSSLEQENLSRSDDGSYKVKIKVKIK